ncbi:DUF3152 domain-containing protein [Actinomadura macrotermitis]|nr:DUF3152 domain-containing protein [Actinomadura macrotermitis]
MQPPRSRPGRRRNPPHRRGAPPPGGTVPPGPDPYGPGPAEPAGPRADPFAVDAEHGIGGDLDRAFAGARRSRARHLTFAIGSLVLVGGLGIGGAVAYGVLSSNLDGGILPPAPAPEAKASRSAPIDSIPSEPPVVKPRVPVYIPAHGTGRFTRAPVTTRRTFGHGKVLRYMVEVEGGLKQRTATFAGKVDTILADRRGWTAGGRWSFRRVDSGPYDFVVRLASPDTTDKLCAAAGMDTEGKVNCSAGKQVVVNLRRWLLLTTFYRGQPDHYHALVINHEVGHRLGFGHMTCAGKGRLAPVMQQQIFGLKGCRVNGWPYDNRGRFISGPRVP